MRRLLVVSRRQRCDEQADGAKVGEHAVLFLVQQADAEEKGEEESEDEEGVSHSVVVAVSRGEGEGEGRTRGSRSRSCSLTAGSVQEAANRKWNSG